MTSQSLQIAELPIKISEACTEYRCGLWCNANGANWCPEYGVSVSPSGGNWYEVYSSWPTTPMYDTGTIPIVLAATIPTPMFLAMIPTAGQTGIFIPRMVLLPGGIDSIITWKKPEPYQQFMKHSIVTETGFLNNTTANVKPILSAGRLLLLGCYSKIAPL